MTRLGKARILLQRINMERGMARQGWVWPGEVRLGRARQDMARHGFFTNGAQPLPEGRKTMTTEVHQFMIKGTSPLMQSNPEEILLSESAAAHGTKSSVAKKKVYDDREECEIRLYKNDGHYCHPTAALRKAMSTAVTGRKWGKTAARGLITKSVYPTAEYVTLCDADGEPLTEYTIDKRSVVINGKARVIRCRPKFMDWMCILTLEIETDITSVDQVLEALTLAGKFVGVGEHRPDSSDGKSGIGTFGRFTATLIVAPEDASDGNGRAAKSKKRKKRTRLPAMAGA